MKRLKTLFCTDSTFSKMIPFIFLISLLFTQKAFSQVFLVFNNNGANGAYIGGGTGAGTVGAKYQWPNVGMEGSVTIKSIIEIVTIYGGATLTSIDGVSSFPDWEPQITGPVTTNGNFWGIKFKISFYDAGTGLPYDVSSFIVNAVDVDGGGGASAIREFAIFQTPFSYTVETPTQLTISFVADGIKFQSGVTALGGPPTKTQYTASCKYFSLNNVTVTCGVSSVDGTSSGLRSHTFSLRSIIDFNDPVTTSFTPLPIDLVDFNAKLMENESVQLTWSTASEINNDYFTLERFDDIQSVSILSLINGSGSSDHQHDYQYIDNYPLSGISYYRLKQTDFDGEFTYSDIISIDNKEPKIEVSLKTNLLGQEVDDEYKGFVFLIYTDGTTARTMQ